MAEEKMERAQKVYMTLCATLEAHDWHYEKNDERLIVECKAKGEDLPIDITIKVDEDRQLLMLLSHLPFTISEDKRLDVAIATSIVNNDLVDGSFDYDITSGTMFFRMTNSFLESDISGELLFHQLMLSCHIIDLYNDKFLMLTKGLIGIEDFVHKK